MPSYRQRGFIETALRSIREQRLAPDSYELLVFDGGSDDGTRELLAAEPMPCRWESTADRGQSHAVNKGLIRAKGDVIAWLNSDDCYLPGVVSAVVEFLDRNRGVDVLYGRAYDIDSNGDRVGEFPSRPWNSGAFRDSCFISQPACFFRKSFAEKNGLLREDLHLAMDYEYWMRAVSWAKFAHYPQFVACNRVHVGAKSSRHRIRQLRESARVSYEAGGEWREAWLRRIASAQGRQMLAPWGLAATRLRVGLSALCYRRMQRNILSGRSPFE